MKKLVLAFAMMFGFVGFAFAQSTDYWFNFKSRQMEGLSSAPSSEHMREYIPQDPAAQRLYDIYIQMGKSPLESLALVIESTLGISDLKNPTPDQGTGQSSEIFIGK